MVGCRPNMPPPTYRSSEPHFTHFNITFLNVALEKTTKINKKHLSQNVTIEQNFKWLWTLCPNHTISHLLMSKIGENFGLPCITLVHTFKCNISMIKVILKFYQELFCEILSSIHNLILNNWIRNIITLLHLYKLLKLYHWVLIIYSENVDLKLLLHFFLSFI